MGQTAISPAARALAIVAAFLMFGMLTGYAQDAGRRPSRPFTGKSVRVDRFGEPRSYNLSDKDVRLTREGEPVLVPRAPMGTLDDTSWDERFKLNGPNDDVHAMVRDGSGNLYIGGEFTLIGDVAANHIAMWDGTNWHALGQGTNGTVKAIVLGSSPDIYVGGTFTEAGGSAVNYVAKWNGASWSDLDGGTNGAVEALAYDSPTLYAGGEFTTVGGVAGTVNYVASWNGTDWSRLGTASEYGTSGVVYALAVDNTGALYVGGTFSQVALSISASNIAMWDGSWSALNDGLDNSVFAIIADGSTIYAGGGFTASGATTYNRVASWNGSGWSGLLNGVDGTVESFAIDSNGDLVVGGIYTDANGIAVNGIAKWTGTAWEGYGDGVDTSVFAVAAGTGGEVFAGGSFVHMDGVVMNHLAHWTGSAWEAMESGLGVASDGEIWALASDGSGNVYAGGAFSFIGGVAAESIAMWDGSSWSALGPGLEPGVEAIEVAPNGDVYAAGQFTATRDGSETLWFIGQWVGNQWWSVGGGLFEPAAALEIDAEGDVYVGGDFLEVGEDSSPVQVDHLAKWDVSETTWSAVGGGTDTPVAAIMIDAFGDLYIGGDFATVDVAGTPVLVSGIAMWDGDSWSDLDGGVSGGFGEVMALAADYGGDIFAGGSFTTAGSTPSVAASNIARWDGARWWALGPGVSGVDSQVNALAKASGGDLFVGGTFTTAGGSPAARIARWSSSSWEAMGSGMNDDVIDLEIGSLYAGGRFDSAGAKPAFGFTTWLEAILDVEIVQIDAITNGAGVQVRWQTENEVALDGFDMEMMGPGSDEWISQRFVSAHAEEGGGARYEVEIPVSDPGTYRFRLKLVDLDGRFTNSDVVEVEVQGDSPVKVSKPYPNPARNAGSIRLVLQRDQEVVITLTDVLGREVLPVYRGRVAANTATMVPIDVGAVAPGWYAVRVQGESFLASERLLVVR